MINMPNILMGNSVQKQSGVLKRYHLSLVQKKFFLSQDDKARVPIGLTAANKQAPLLVHMEYRVTLPDHDWVIANKHKLIPSVYVAIEVHSDGLGKPSFVDYSGPTYIAVRSGRHSSSTALSHALDFNKLIDFSKNGSFVKPVVILTVDGGPGENPRYQKIVYFWLQMHQEGALLIESREEWHH
nr:uncharacterized protein LOC124814705 [Hydra vulgaris]